MCLKPGMNQPIFSLTMTFRPLHLSISFVLLFAGCMGFDIPNPANMMPYTMIDGGQQFGRDQLANRALVAANFPLIKGMHQNDLLTALGQPQSVDIIERNVSEDWYFVYYKKYKTAKHTDKGTFLVRLYNEKVIDVVTL